MKARYCLLVAAAIAVAGCATTQPWPDPRPGQFTSYRDESMSRMRMVAHDIMTSKGVPGDLREEVYGCEADVVIDKLTPTEIQHWDAYARGEITATLDEKQAFDNELDRRTGGSDAIRGLMQKRCPDTVAKIAKYGI